MPLLRIVDEFRRIRKIGFAAPYAQYQTRKSRIQKIGFATLSKTEGISRRDSSNMTLWLKSRGRYGRTSNVAFLPPAHSAPDLPSCSCDW
jgi:hypothetical protein